MKFKCPLCKNEISILFYLRESFKSHGRLKCKDCNCIVGVKGFISRLIILFLIIIAVTMFLVFSIIEKGIYGSWQFIIIFFFLPIIMYSLPIRIKLFNFNKEVKNDKSSELNQSINCSNCGAEKDLVFIFKLIYLKETIECDECKTIIGMKNKVLHRITETVCILGVIIIPLVIHFTNGVVSSKGGLMLGVLAGIALLDIFLAKNDLIIIRKGK